jgi:hypothetical protein
VTAKLSSLEALRPRPNICPYADEQAAVQVVDARLVVELDPQAIGLFGRQALSHPSPLRRGWTFAVANGRDGALPFLTVQPPLPADLWSSTFPATGKDECQAFAVHQHIKK